MNPIREKIEYGLLIAVFTFLRLSPKVLIYGTCNLFAVLFYLLASKRRKISMQNLQIAFPDLSEKERVRMAKAAYNHFGQFLAESAMVLCGKITRNDLEKMIDGSELEELMALEASTEKGILAITGHLGNFELLALYTGSHAKRQSHIVAREGSNRLIDQNIVKPMRRAFGNELINKDRALPLIARALKKGEHIGILVDIKSNAKQGVPITFFGKETYGIKSSAFLQIKIKPLVVPMTMIRVAPRKYKLVVKDPIEWSDNGKSMDDQITELTQIHQSALEDMIRLAPEQWLWMHNRWKK